jgi:hypothetical protein
LARYKPKHQTDRTRRERATIGLMVASILVALAGGGLYLHSYLHSSRLLSESTRLALSKSPKAGDLGVAATKGLPAATTVPAATRANAPFTSAETAPWMVAENAKPGTRDWILTQAATDHQIEGYSSAVSVNQGGSVNVYVSTTAPSFSVQAFRMGYYGGTQGRMVWSLSGIAGIQQPDCPITFETHMVSCNWQTPVSLSTADWPQGEYLLKLQSSTGWQSYVPLTVRDDSSQSAYLVNSSVTTWQAYNVFGGYDLYQGPSPGGSSLADRALAVSFDRPYVLGDGAGDFVGLELPMVSMMESQGLDISYTTDVDLAAQSSLLTQHKSFVSLGHDEYYSLAMRDGLQAARDAGVNLVFLGANAIYRHVRFTSSPLGADREMIDYKNPQLDPLLGVDNADVTPWAWRNWPNNAPESSLIGEMWQCNPVSADMVITDPGNWMFNGTGLGPDSHIVGIVGPEYDHFDPYEPNPGNVSVVARSPVTCGGLQEEADMTYYSAPSGAGVWDTGTIDWVGSVIAYCPGCQVPDQVTQITANVLAAFGARPAGAAHPSTATLPLTSGTPSTTSVPTNSLNESPTTTAGTNN